jgi:RND family efflux transporter MFP subunit
MSRQLKWVIGLLLGAGVIAAVMIALRPEPVEQELETTAPLVQTVAYSVTSGPIAIRGVGTVQPREEVTLGAEVAGKLTYVNPSFREGRSLPRGALLLRIDPAEYANRVRSAQADVAAQEVALLQAREEAAIAEAELRQFAQRDRTREVLTGAGGQGGSTARILPPDELLGSVNAAAPQEQAEPNLLATREPQLRSAEAARERAEAQLADARLALARTEVRAPFSGIVRSESAAIGTLVQPGQSLGSIVATDFYEVQVSLSEAEARLLPTLFGASRNDISAEIVLDYGELSYRWPAVVDRVDPILDPETRTINVFLRVPNPMRPGTPVSESAAAMASSAAAPPLLLGSFVRATITGDSQRPYAIIPLEALRTGNEVWLLRDGRLQIVTVEVIQRADQQAWVSAPELGDAGQIVVSSLRSPVAGMPLRAQGNSTDQDEPEGAARPAGAAADEGAADD